MSFMKEIQTMSNVMQSLSIGYLPIVIRIREDLVRQTRSQTMTEYALILAAVAVCGAHAAMGK